ncbi:MAG: formylglycine-generating enzyme family protein [Phycisphaerales bacterium]|jgi:formylglycine-generating enzyme required for sulfatase activity|nr:formylglycine-generating enzyme family protein [Phycisphaerales bacterium]
MEKMMNRAGWRRQMIFAKSPSRKPIYSLVLLMLYVLLARGDAILADEAGKVAKSVGEPPPKPLVFNLGKDIRIKFVRIPAGTFTMGSPNTEKGRHKNEGPQRKVTISKVFYMGAAEVTQAQYQAIMGKNPSKFQASLNPVENVTWNQADEFCRKLSAKIGQTVRLPTEAQWEYACRWNEDLPSIPIGQEELAVYGWNVGNSGGKTHPAEASASAAAQIIELRKRMFPLRNNADAIRRAGKPGWREEFHKAAVLAALINKLDHRTLKQEVRRLRVRLRRSEDQARIIMRDRKQNWRKDCRDIMVLIKEERKRIRELEDKIRKIIAIGKPRPDRLFGMHGNVQEWCRDFYAESYQNAKNSDPENTTKSGCRVIRNGSWNTPVDRCRPASRQGHPPDKAQSQIGFRVIIEPRGRGSQGVESGSP